MGASSSSSSLRVVVVIGGGAGGVTVSRILDSDGRFFVVLIDRKGYYFHNVGSLRGAVDSSFASKVMVPYTNVFPKGNGIFVQGFVEAVDADGNVTIRGRAAPIHADAVVLATGSSYGFPSSVPLLQTSQMTAAYAEIHKRVAAASSILIIGGGPVGLELSGEIASKYPSGKKITVVTKGDQILAPKFNKEFTDKIVRKMDAKGIAIRYGETVDFEALPPSDEESKSSTSSSPPLVYHSYASPKEVDLKSGRESFDLIFDCTGIKLNRHLFANFESHVDGATGKLKTTPLLHLEGHKNIFVIGDANSLQQSMAFFAAEQAKFVGKHLWDILVEGKGVNPYEPLLHPVMIVTLGPGDGAGQLPTKGGAVVGGVITKVLKGKTLMWEAAWKTVGQKWTPGTAPAFEPVSLDPSVVEKAKIALKISDEEVKSLASGYSKDVPDLGQGTRHL